MDLREFKAVLATALREGLTVEVEKHQYAYRKETTLVVTAYFDGEVVSTTEFTLEGVL